MSFFQFLRTIAKLKHDKNRLILLDSQQIYSIYIYTYIYIYIRYCNAHDPRPLTSPLGTSRQIFFSFLPARRKRISSLKLFHYCILLYNISPLLQLGFQSSTCRGSQSRTVKCQFQELVSPVVLLFYGNNTIIAACNTWRQRSYGERWHPKYATVNSSSVSVLTQ